MVEERPPSKREVMLALLEHAEAQVHLDARRDGVVLPAKLRASSNVRLDYGYSLVPPIPDLAVDEDGIRATLSFNRAPFQTFVPWSAVFLIADFTGRGAVWREDLPPELMSQVPPGAGADEAHEGEAPAEATGERPPEAPTRRFGVMDGDAPAPASRRAPSDNDGDGDDDRPDPEPPRPRPALRLVK